LCRSGTEYICINDAASAWIEVAQNIDRLGLLLIVPVSTPKIDPFAKFIAERVQWSMEQATAKADWKQ
jgi:hypothetical protein